MTPLGRAFDLLDGTVRPIGTVQVPLDLALGRYLASPVCATSDMPPFAKSAMDGFAVRNEDLGGPESALPVRGMVAAGSGVPGALEPGTAVQIMTGAPVPAGADQVVRVEFSDQKDGRVRFHSREGSSNIIAQGENAAAGDTLVTPRRLRAHDIGVVAAVGLASLDVFAQPVMGVLSTGDELLEPGQEPIAGSIFNSNAYQLIVQGRNAGYDAKYFGIARDTEASLREHLQRVLAQVDVVVLSGGVSKGEFDYVPGVLGELGVETVFHRIAVKPGRPTYFGIRDENQRRQYVFGLPGNPVSTFVMFELFVRRLILRMARLDAPGPDRVVELGVTIRKNDPERTEFYPVRIDGERAYPIRYRGSSHINALSAADGLIELPTGISEMKEGSRIGVRSI